MRRIRSYSQDRIEDHIAEQQDALDEDQEHTQRECATLRLSASEQLVVEDAGLCSFPLIHAEADEDNSTAHKRAESASAHPGVETASEVEASQ